MIEGKPSRTTFRSRLDDMVKTLREEIISGQRQVGEYLPSELALAEQFQLSKNSIRKGLEILVHEGLIEKKPRMGNMVSMPPEGIVHLKFGYYPSLISEAEITRLVEHFQAENPYIRVQCISLPFDKYYTTVKEYMELQMLDVVSINYTDYQSFVENNDLSTFEPLQKNPEIYPFLTKPFSANDQLYVQPLIFSPIILCYNRNHFSKKNIAEPDSSWSWEDLINTSASLTENDSNAKRFGFYFHLSSQNRWPVFLLQSGIKFERNEREKYKLCHTELMESLKVCRDLIYNQGIPMYLSENDSDAETLFLQEKVSMIMTTYFSLNTLRQAKFPFDVAPLPYLHDPKTLLLIIGLAIHSQTKNKEAAKLFVQYLTTQAPQLWIRQHTLSIPSNKLAAEWTGKEKSYRPSRFQMFREIIPTFKLYTSLQLSSAQLEMIRQELKLFWSNMEDEEQVCRRLEELL